MSGKYSSVLRTLAVLMGFLMLLAFAGACTGTVRGTIFADLDGDKVRSTKEEALPHVLLEYTRDKEKIGTGLTDEDGNFSFRIKKGGYICVRAVKESFGGKAGNSSGAGGETFGTDLDVEAKAKAQWGTGVSNTCFTHTDCLVGQTCVNGYCEDQSVETEDGNEDAEDEEVKRDEDTDDDDGDAANTSTTSEKQPVVEDCKVCEEINLNKDGLNIPVIVSFDNLAKLPTPGKVDVGLNRTKMIYFTYPKDCKFEQVFLPSILVPAGKAGVKNIQMNMVDLSTNPDLPIVGMRFDLDEAILVRKGFGIKGVKPGKATIEAEVECPNSVITLPSQKVEVAVTNPKVSQTILGMNKPKAGDQFMIEVTIDGNDSSGCDSAELLFSPSPYIEDVGAMSGGCENLGDNFECDVTANVGGEVSKSFQVRLPEAVDNGTNFVFEAKLKCEIAGETAEIPAENISVTILSGEGLE